MLTSKQRAHLRSIAQSYNTIFFVGKLGIGDELVKQLDDVLICRVLKKVGVDENCDFTDSEAADLYANVVCVKEGNENNEAVQALVKVLTSDEIRDYINTQYNGVFVPVF